jgi:hypothetical protein
MVIFHDSEKLPTKVTTTNAFPALGKTSPDAVVTRATHQEQFVIRQSSTNNIINHIPIFLIDTTDTTS